MGLGGDIQFQLETYLGYHLISKRHRKIAILVEFTVRASKICRRFQATILRIHIFLWNIKNQRRDEAELLQHDEPQEGQTHPEAAGAPKLEERQKVEAPEPEKGHTHYEVVGAPELEEGQTSGAH